MSNYSFELTGTPASGTEAFSDATADELKVLVAVIEHKSFDGIDELSEISGVSVARSVAALTLWQQVGVIRPVEESFYGNKVTEEFTEVSLHGLDEEPSAVVAEHIRSNKLAGLFRELAALVGKPMLSPAEVNKISALSIQYAVSAEYIATLAAHMSEKGELTMYKLVNRAMRLCEQGIDRVEELETYISDKERDSAEAYEFCRVFGIKNRRLSGAEQEFVRRWMREYGFSAEIIAEAYSICTLNTTRMDLRYIDTILTSWHKDGCVTVADCRASSERTKPEQQAAPQKRVSNAKKAAPRLSDFDPDEALRLALERSFPTNK